MPNTDPTLDNLPREPRSQLDFLWLIGFIRLIDLPFLVGMVFSPIGIAWHHYDGHDVTKPLIVLLVLYVFWLCILVFRAMHFTVKCIGAVKNVSFDAARLATAHITGRPQS